MKLFGESFHWLDSNVFIQAKNGPYGFEVAPSFWTWLESVTKEGLVRSPINVCTELTKGKDQLARWASRMRSRGLFVSPDHDVQKYFGDVATFVQATYGHPYSAKFLDGADPWVIAHAGEGQGVVVTHEVLVSTKCKDVKIPNVCDHFGIKCIEPYAAFRKLGLRL
jgi:hypothetical protein